MDRKHYACGVAAGVMALAAWTAAGAQESTTGTPATQTVNADDPSTLEEIVVTARKTTENLQDAPATIVSASGEELVERGIGEPQQLEKIFPGLNLRQNGPVTQTYIRGVGTRSDTVNFSSATATTLNGIILSRYATFGITYDLGNVQAIAGPQGTLYGGSAAGGAINFNTARPENDYGGVGLVEVGDYDARRVSVAQNLPLGDRVSVRGAIDYSSRDSYFNNGLNSRELLQTRVSVLADPTDDITALFFYNFAIDEGEPLQTVQTKPLFDASDPYRLPTRSPLGHTFDTSRTRQDNQNNILGANIEWRTDGNVFTYIPGFVRVSADYFYYSGASGGLLQVYDLEQAVSQELRWNREIGAFQLSGGLFYLRNEILANSSQDRAIAGPSYLTVRLSQTDQVNTNTAVYGQVVWSASDRLRLTAGARLSQDEIEASGSGFQGGRLTPFAFEDKQSRPDYKLGVDYDLAPDILVYANLQTGYVPFAYNPDITPAALVPESELLAFSGGVKSRFLDRRLEINAEAFHYDYQNFQAIAFVNATGLSTVLSAEQATIYGIDLSVRAILPFATEFNASVVLQNARYDDFNGVGYNFDGNEMINAPDVNIVAGLQHTVDLGASGELLARVDTHYESGHFGNFNNFPNSFTEAYTKTDLSLTYAPAEGAWSVQGFVQNIEDDAVYVNLAPGATPAAPATGGVLAPRTYGVRLTTSW